jgi:3-(3-hydroxy-phenyl)propionate hydroxylase
MRAVDVVIVGLGPTGATLAGLLGQRGLRVAAFDRLPDLYPLPRAAGFDHEVMRVIQELGLAERMLPHVAPYRPSEYRGVDGQLIKRFDMAPPPHRLGWAPNYVFDQPAFERLLRARLSELPSVRFACSAEVTGWEQSGRSVRVEVRHADGATETVEAKYLIACDGGSSPIRKGLGIGLEDLQFDEHWLVVDALVNRDRLASLPQTQVQYCEPARPSTFVVLTGQHRRWELMLLPGESLSESFPEAELWPLLARWIKPGDARLWRAAAYRFHGLVAERWREGRILLAGDSAHMTPPFMAQGMCQGIRDALNLAWKLERVIAGGVPDSLLDSYETERRPHVTATTLAAMALGRIICERDETKARARDRRMLEECGGEVGTTIRQTMLPDVSGGLIAAGALGAGSLFPQPRVRTFGRPDVRRLDDVTGSCLRVLVHGDGSGEEEAALFDLVQRVDGRLVCLEGDAPRSTSSGLSVAEEGSLLRDWMAAHRACFAIVRPDHCVYATAATAVEAARHVRALGTALGLVRPEAG